MCNNEKSALISVKVLKKILLHFQSLKHSLKAWYISKLVHFAGKKIFDIVNLKIMLAILMPPMKKSVFIRCTAMWKM